MTVAFPLVIAHVFLAPYTLPVPFWLYLYGCAATLVVSFGLLAYFATMGVPGQKVGRLYRVPRWIVAALRAGALAALALTIAASLWGPADPNVNVAMTLFWVCFLLAFAYLTALIGDLYAWTNPWSTLASALGQLGVSMDRPRLEYPRGAAYWPAVIMYVALIWIELFALPRPALLAEALAIYTAVTLVGIYVFGRTVWLQHAELFSVLFRVIGSLAPVAYVANPAAAPSGTGGHHDVGMVLRKPLSGAVAAGAEHVSLVAFVLFMLAGTTYDSLHETSLWVSLYWRRLLPILQPLWGGDVVSAQATLTTGYWWYQSLGLIVAPMFYFLLYVGVMWATRAAAGAPLLLRTVSGRLVFSLVPIAVGYHAAHYVPSMIMQLPSLLPQLADPFYKGWRLLPATAPAVAPLQMGVVWHAQVFVLLAGHIAAVYVAHVAALDVFPTHRQSVVSQLPMLALMIGYTFLGLWALSLPLGVPQIG